MPQLKKYRDIIDEIDSQIINLLAQRFEIVKKVGEYKKQNDLPPLQPERWQQVLSSKKQLAKQYGINPDFVEKIWNEIHDYALDIEK